jgi:hypothetical protein
MKKLSLAVMAVIIMMAIIAGCGVTDSDPGNRGNQRELDPKLILGNAQAWVMESRITNGVITTYTDSDVQYCIIFKSDSTLLSAENYDGHWLYTGRSSSWYVRDNKMDDGSTYTVSNNKLTITTDPSYGGSIGIYAKTDGVNPTNHMGGYLILPDGQAWESCGNNSVGCHGYVFNSNGRYRFISDSQTSNYKDGTWTTEGNEVILSSLYYDAMGWGSEYHVAYTVMDNKLFLNDISSGSAVYTRGNIGSMYLVLGDGQAWVTEEVDELGPYLLGLIFHSDGTYSVAYTYNDVWVSATEQNNGTWSIGITDVGNLTSLMTVTGGYLVNSDMVFYTVDDNTLSFYSKTYTKTDGVYPISQSSLGKSLNANIGRLAKR